MDQICETKPISRRHRGFAKRTQSLLFSVSLILPAPLLAEPQPGAAERLAALYGRTLGAAASCRAVAAARVETVAQQAADHLKAVAQTEADAGAAAARLAASIARGRRAIASGIETCAQAESEFVDLERDLAR